MYIVFYCAPDSQGVSTLLVQLDKPYLADDYKLERPEKQGSRTLPETKILCFV
jgi:hypothetical protein